MYKQKTFLITGGTGSFGKTVTKYLLSKDCKEIRVFSRDEAKHDQMRKELDDTRIKFYIGDTRDYTGVDSAMRGVDYVFHAAALKQVPSCEFFPMQAVKTNVIGSDNVIRSAITNKVKKVICLSTDKAVYPINAMGISKAMMEKIAQSHARNLSEEDTVINCVRYGNVMYSRGSVIPLFIEQIKADKDLTITEPSMTRFLLSLTDSVTLVEYAFAKGQQGDVFIKKAPACTVADLATALKNLFKSNKKTVVIGIRHGEKLHETLASKEELARSEDLGDYYRIKLDGRDLNYKPYFSKGKTHYPLEDYTSDNTRRLSIEETEKLLLKLPEVRSELGLLD